MKNKVLLLLSLTLLTMGLLPFGAAFIFIKDAFLSQESIYKSQELGRVLRETQEHLKKLSKLDSINEQGYRDLFEEIQDVKLIYGEDTYFSDRLKTTLSKYFFVGFGAFLAVSLLLGFYLSTLINKIYKKSYEDLQEQRDRSKYLEEIARWQEVAKKLAHEIKRPLQPIAMWISNLKSCYSLQSPSQFSELITEASAAIQEETTQLSRMVEEFARFADLPKPQKKMLNVEEFFKKFITQYAGVWSHVHFSIACRSDGILCPLDGPLLRQVLTNMVENAVEANPSTGIEVELSAQLEGSELILEVFNSGAVLTKDQREKIFDPYFSTKHTKKNMGLGLSIVKLAILEHGGEVKCIEENRGVRFRIRLPLTTEVQNAS